MELDAEKQLRADRFHDPSKGKRRRRMMPYRQKYDCNELERIERSSVSSTTDKTSYSMTQLDWLLPGFNLKADPEEIRNELRDMCTSCHIIPKQRAFDLRQCEAFDLEITSQLIPNQHDHMQMFAQLTDDCAVDKARVRASFKPNRYYQFRTPMSRRHLNSNSGDGPIINPRYFTQHVRAMPAPSVVVIDPTKEQLLVGKTAFVSHRTKPYPQTNVRGTGKSHMIDQHRVNRALASCCSMSFMRNTNEDNYYWASSPAPNNDYQDWFCEFDFGAMVQPTAIVLQGKPPRITSYPCGQEFAVERDIAKYQGPIYPCLMDDVNAGNWVELFRVQIRKEKGKWIDLGTVFKGNCDNMSEVRVNLPTNPPQCRYLRIQPLSESRGGFHGRFPAMRCAVIGHLHATSVAARLAHMQRQNDSHELEHGHVRFVLKTPNEQVHGYSMAGNRTFIQGATLNYLGGSTGRFHTNNKMILVAMVAAWSAWGAQLDAPLMGWSTWESLAKTVSDEHVMRNARFLVSSGLQAKGYRMVQVDDGWQELDRATGWISRVNYRKRPNNKQGADGLPALVGNGTAGCIVPDAAKFPRGMQALGAELKQLGLQFGMYTSGTNFVCDAEAGFRGSYSSTAYANLRSADANCFARWGADLLKVDSCIPDSFASSYNENIIRFWRGALGSDVVLYNCRFGCMAQTACGNVYACPTQTSAAQNAKVSSYCTSQTDISRTGPDIKPAWSNILGAISTTSQFGMWCVVSAPLLISVELTTVDLPTLAMLGDDMAIGINQLYQGDAGDLKSKTGNLWEFQKKFNVKTAVVVVNVGVDRSTASFPMQDYLTWQPKLNSFMVGAVACQYIDVWTKQTGWLTASSQFRINERDSLFIVVTNCGSVLPPDSSSAPSSARPASVPTSEPSAAKPTNKATTTKPTKRPTLIPTKRPSTSMPTKLATSRPSLPITEPPSAPSASVTNWPSKRPTTAQPSAIPTSWPSMKPTSAPTQRRTNTPTNWPTKRQAVKSPTFAPNPRAIGGLECAMDDPNTSRLDCQAKAQKCNMKWVDVQCLNNGLMTSVGGCKCSQYCAYSCPTACNLDAQCYWNLQISQCFNKLTQWPDQQPINPQCFL
ncbi:hypothetical protein BASA81_015063 [Batrachochytrium salamandrivorans]|nr:hypothetical protein BASA81_015063 [Batrachochytrium salamandrivorans]